LVSTLLGPKYSDSVILLRLLALWCIPVAINQPCVAFMQARGQERFLAVVTLAITAGNLVMTAVLASTLGAVAIPIVSLVGFSTLSVILVRRVNRSRVMTTA
jgi:O-antigen/teichoic acid export membrane protein